MPRFSAQWVALRSIFAFTALLAVAVVHAQQKINVTAVNSINNQILSVTFAPPGGSTTVLNTDAKSLYSLQSLVFVTNPNTFAIDLFAADNQNGKILDYVGDLSAGAFLCPPNNTNPPCTTGTVVTQAASIIYPNGLSTDNAGDLFVLNEAPGKSPLPQVWVLQPNALGGFQNAALIDKTHFAKSQAAVESLVVGVPLGNVQTGDLLVVTSNPTTVLQYHINLPNPLTTPNLLIPQCAAPGSQNCIPAGTVPGGIAVWPQDGSPFSNSVLISTQGGSILSFTISGNNVVARNPDFHDGLPAGLFKIKTGLQNGAALAFVAQSGPGNHGSILELGPCANFPQDAACTPNPQGIGVVATVSSGVAAPEGIAVTNTVQTATANCAQAKGGCDNFGGETLKHTVIPDGPGNLNSNLVESLCLVPQDPRVVGGVFNGGPLPVNQVCPGFDNTNVPNNPMTIPGNFRGASGATGAGFALFKSLTAYPSTSPSQFNQTYLDAEQNTDTLFPNAMNPLCGNNGGTAVVLWAPLAGETPIVEGSPTPTLVDITDGCDAHGGGPSISIFGVGFALALTGDNTLTGFAGTKYQNLKATIQQLAASGNITPAVASQLTNGSTGCVDLSLSLFQKALGESPPQQTADFQDAADLLTNADTSGTTTCDSIITTNPNAFPESPGATPPVFNPSGQVRWRLANLYYTIETPILNLPPASTWPPPVSLSASPQYVSVQCAAQACPQPPAQLPPLIATLSWALASMPPPGDTNCALTSNSDSYFNSNPPNLSGNNPPTFWTVEQGLVLPGTTYTYTLKCNVPAATNSTQVTVTAAPSGSGYMGGTLTAPWPNPTAANYPVTLSTGQMISACTFTQGIKAFSCSSTNITGTPSVTIDVSFPTMSVSTNVTTWPAVAVSPSLMSTGGGQAVTVTWTPPAGATNCTLINNGAPGASWSVGSITTVAGPTDGSTQYQATYQSVGNDGLVTFTGYCTAGASFGSASTQFSE
jgi:hypothetical protein